MGMESWSMRLSRPPLVSMVHCLVVSGLDIVLVGLVCRGFCGGLISGWSGWLMVVTRKNTVEQCSGMMLNRHCNLIYNLVHLDPDAVHCAPLQRMVLDVDMTC